MNGLSTNILFLMLAMLLMSAGCQKETANNQEDPTPSEPIVTDQSQPELQSGPTADAILRSVIARYANAKTYQDNATLYLSYQLHGRSIQEPQRWSTKWDANGRLATQLFNGNVRCDEGLLSCYVYDIETANIDSQHLLVPFDGQLPINQLYRDSIAKHFLGGFSELPLDETDLVAMPKLVPPPISLLTNQARNGWLQNPTQAIRLPDAVVDDLSCYVVRCLWQGMTSDIWIDQQTTKLVQISLPLKLLAGEVVTSPEITDVVLMAKFHDAKFDAPIEDSEFAIAPRPNSTPVLKFVPLPETIPCELIGQTAPDFQLLDQSKRPIGQTELKGKVTTLMWLAGKPSFNAIRDLDRLAKKLNNDKLEFAAVYSDSELKSPGVNSFVVDELADIIRSTAIPAYYDPTLTASSALQIKTIPSVLVLDKDLKVHFAEPVSNKNWLRNVEAAVERVAAGDDVSVEMQREYQRFLDSYHQQLTTVSAKPLIDPDASDAPATTVPKTMRRVATNIRLRPEKIWSNSEFKQAGNVAVLPLESTDANRTRYLIFDGWQTVVQLDETGKTLARVNLKLRQGAAANLIRVGSRGNEKPIYGVFSKLGQELFLFDEDWKPVGVYPKEFKHEGIRDCQLTDLNDDGKSEIVVSFEDDNGIHLVDVESLTGQKISELLATSVAQHNDDVVVTGDGKLGMLKTGLTNAEETELSFRRVTTLENDLLCGLGMTDNGQWNAVGFDDQLKRIWTLSIGSQFFETEIEPVSVAKSSDGESIWAIADTDDAIHLVSGGGNWLGDFQSESKLGGLALANQDGRLCLIVSNQTGIECWDLNVQASPMRPASSRK